jgi:hypothetical protein
VTDKEMLELVLRCLRLLAGVPDIGDRLEVWAHVQLRLQREVLLQQQGGARAPPRDESYAA